MVTPPDLALSAAQQQLLARYGFDAAAFASLRAQLAQGAFGAARNRFEGPIEPPRPGDLTPWPEPGSAERARLAELGRTALARGEVAVAILNGGMATRFGGVVKGVVPVDGDATFLQLKLRASARIAPRAPIFLMNSFATGAATEAHIDALPERPLVHPVAQSISMRLTEAGKLFLDGRGEPSFYAPGHGDLLGALRHSPAYQAFVAAGGKYVAVSNVDNLAATLSEVVLGAHIAGGLQMTVEVAPRDSHDTGGAPVRMGDRLAVLEGFRFPEGFDMDALPVFNTNTFVLGAQAIATEHPLSWFRADKKVEGSPVVQFERLLGELTSFVPATYLQVPRTGAECRFLPVKAPSDLPGILPWVHAHLGG